MPNVILLDAAQASAIAGPSTSEPNCMIAPMPLTDGRYFVGVEVLEDPAHAEHYTMLSTLPVVDYETLTALIPPAHEE